MSVVMASEVVSACPLLFVYSSLYELVLTLEVHKDFCSYKETEKEMPLFNKKFESKPIPPRTSRCNNGCPMVAEELDDYKQISLNLGNKELRFADGIWIHASRKSDVDDVVRLNRRYKTLEEEKNMSDVKVEVLLDLLTEHAIEINMLKANKNN